MSACNCRPWRAPNRVIDRGRILVVEDEDTIRQVLELVLGDEGYDVRGVPHGRAALEVLRDWPAQLILLDMMLPIMDGWTFLEERRRLNVAGAARVIVVSASRVAQSTEATQFGVDAIVPKPFDLERLLGLVDSSLQGRGPH